MTSTATTSPGWARVAKTLADAAARTALQEHETNAMWAAVERAQQMAVQSGGTVLVRIPDGALPECETRLITVHPSTTRH